MLINAVSATYTGAKTSVLVDGQKSEEFGVSVGVHQGSILSPLLFITVMQYVTESARHNDLMELLYADDLALCDETVTGVLAKYHKWKTAMERKGQREEDQRHDYERQQQPPQCSSHRPVWSMQTACWGKLDPLYSLHALGTQKMLQNTGKSEFGKELCVWELCKTD